MDDVRYMRERIDDLVQKVRVNLVQHVGHRENSREWEIIKTPLPKRDEEKTQEDRKDNRNRWGVLFMLFHEPDGEGGPRSRDVLIPDPKREET